MSPSESASPDAVARGGGGHSTHGGAVATKAADGAMRSADEPVEVSISPEAAKRAGIRVVEVKRGTI